MIMFAMNPGVGSGPLQYNGQHRKNGCWQLETRTGKILTIFPGRGGGGGMARAEKEKCEIVFMIRQPLFSQRCAIRFVALVNPDEDPTFSSSSPFSLPSSPPQRQGKTALRKAGQA